MSIYIKQIIKLIKFSFLFNLILTLNYSTIQKKQQSIIKNKILKHKTNKKKNFFDKKKIIILILFIGSIKLFSIKLSHNNKLKEKSFNKILSEKNNNSKLKIKNNNNYSLFVNKTLNKSLESNNFNLNFSQSNYTEPILNNQSINSVVNHQNIEKQKILNILQKSDEYQIEKKYLISFIESNNHKNKFPEIYNECLIPNNQYFNLFNNCFSNKLIMNLRKYFFKNISIIEKYFINNNIKIFNIISFDNDTKRILIQQDNNKYLLKFIKNELIAINIIWNDIIIGSFHPSCFYLYIEKNIKFIQIDYNHRFNDINNYNIKIVNFFNKDSNIICDLENKTINKIIYENSKNILLNDLVFYKNLNIFKTITNGYNNFFYKTFNYSKKFITNIFNINNTYNNNQFNEIKSYVNNIYIPTKKDIENFQKYIENPLIIQLRKNYINNINILNKYNYTWNYNDVYNTITIKKDNELFSILYLNFNGTEIFSMKFFYEGFLYFELGKSLNDSIEFCRIYNNFYDYNNNLQYYQIEIINGKKYISYYNNFSLLLKLLLIDNNLFYLNDNLIESQINFFLSNENINLLNNFYKTIFI
jgi:hypothetical protein